MDTHNHIVCHFLRQTAVNSSPKKPYLLLQQWLYNADDIFRNQIQCTEDKRSDSLEKCITDYILTQESNANVCHAQVQYICIFRQQLRSGG